MKIPKIDINRFFKNTIKIVIKKFIEIIINYTILNKIQKIVKY